MQITQEEQNYANKTTISISVVMSMRLRLDCIMFSCTLDFEMFT